MSSFDTRIILRLVDQLTAPARNAGNAYSKMSNDITASSNRIAASNAGLNRTKRSLDGVTASALRTQAAMRGLSTGFAGGAGGFLGAMAIYPMVGMVKRAADYESKLLDVRKVWTGAQSEYDKLVVGLRELNTEMPLSRLEIGTLAEEGIRAGVGKTADEIKDFTKSAAMFATAFNLSIDDAAPKLAKLKSQLAMTMPEFTSLGDTMNTLANTSATNEGELLEFMTRIGGLANSIAGKQGVLDVLTIGAAQMAAGTKREVAATGLRTLIARLNTQPKDTQKAIKKLGIDPEQVKIGMTTDLLGTVTDIFERLAALPDKDRAGVLAQLSGMKTFDAFARLLGNLKLLEQQTDTVRGKFRLTMASEFERRLTSLNSLFQITANILGDMSDSLVMQWRPQIASFLKMMQSLAQTLSGSQTAGWALGIMAVMAAISALTLPISMLGFSIMGMKAAWIALSRLAWGLLLPLRLIFGTIARQLWLIYRFAGAAGLLRTALLIGFGPIGWIIGGLALIVSYWDQLKDAARGFASAWEGSEMQAGLQKLADWSAPYFLSTFQWLASNTPGLLSVLQNIGKAISDLFGWGDDGNSATSEGRWGWFEAGRAAAEKLLNPLRSINEILSILPSWAGGTNYAGDLGVPESLQDKDGKGGLTGAAARKASRMPKGMSMENTGPNVTVKQAPPNIINNVTINATTNASASEIGAAAAGAVGQKVRGALSDAPHSAP